MSGLFGRRDFRRAALFNFFDRGLRSLEGGGERCDVGQKTVRFALSIGN
jgi:hypothetical protein